ncbi:pentatricopeptide repeat-containing protein At4g20090 [Fagus crenata]
MPKCSAIHTNLLTNSLLRKPLLLSTCNSFSTPPSLHSHFSSLLIIPSPTKTLENNPQTDPLPLPNEIFNSSPNFGSYKLGDSTFYSLIHNYADSGDFASLHKVLDRMKRENRTFIEKSFVLMFRAYGKANLPNKAVELFDRMAVEFRCRRTVRSFNSVLNVIIQLGCFSQALEFYSRVMSSKNVDIEPNVLTFNLVIKALCKLGLVDNAVEVFREMPVRECTPDVFTYGTLMDGLCREDRIDEAVSLLDEMQMEGCFPSAPTFNVLINALCKKGDLARAAKLVDNMFLKGCVPNEVTYNTLIHGLCLKGRLEKAVSLLDRMVSSKCVPNDVTYGTIINGLVKQGRALDGARVLISMEERGHRANEYVYSVLVSGLFREGKIEEAMNLWKEMKEKGCKPNTVVYSAFIDGLCREGKLVEAKEVLSEMVNEGCVPNAFTYSSLMKGFFQMGDSHNAILVWKQMSNNNCTRNEVCYSVLIHGLCGDGKLREALMVWNQMLGQGFKPDVVAYSSMIRGLCSAGLIDQGLKLFNEMLFQEPESQPDVITYNLIFNALCKQSSISRAIDLLNSMLDRGCDPDLVTCDIFLRTLREKIHPPQDGREFLDELVVRLFKRQRSLGALRIVEVMLKKYLPLKASTWARVVQEICKPKKIQAGIDKSSNQIRLETGTTSDDKLSTMHVTKLTIIALKSSETWSPNQLVLLISHIISCKETKEYIVYSHYKAADSKSDKCLRTQRCHEKDIVANLQSTKMETREQVPQTFGVLC